MPKFGRTVRLTLFWMSALCILILPPIAYLYSKDIALAGLIITCAGFFCILVRIEEIEEFSLGGLKAKMRESVREAIATVEQLRQIAVATGRVALTDLAAGNFFSGMPTKTRFRLFNELLDSLKAIGASDSQLEFASEEWRKATAFVYAREITGLICKINVSDKDLAKHFEGLGDFQTWTPATPEIIEAVVATKNLTVDESIKALLKDYKQFVKSGVVPNEDFLVRFIDRQNT